MTRALALAATGLLWTTGCFTDQPSEGGGTGDPSCAEGSVGCLCYPNDTCDATLVCSEEAQRCAPEICSPLVPGCPCPDDGCGDSLVCRDLICEMDAPSSGSSTGSVDSGSSTTTGGPATAVTLYFSSSDSLFSSGYAGAADARAGAQNLCDTSMAMLDLDPACTHSAALMSTGVGDSVLELETTAEMPFSLPVFAPGGMMIADSFQDLLTNGTRAILPSLGVSYANATGAPDFFWTGSQSTGATGNNCEGWTVLEGEGKAGQPPVGSGEFWLTNNNFPCSMPAPLLCACWD